MCKRDVYTGCDRDHRGRHLDHAGGQFVCSDPACIAAAARLRAPAEAATLASSEAGPAGDRAAAQQRRGGSALSCGGATAALGDAAATDPLVDYEQQPSEVSSAGGLRSIRGLGANARSLVATAAYFGTVWALLADGTLIAQTDDGAIKGRSSVALTGGQALASGSVTVNPMNPAAAAVTMRLAAGSAAPVTALRVASLLPQQLGGEGGDDSASSAAVATVHLPPEAAAGAVHVAWGLGGEDLMIAADDGGIFRAVVDSDAHGSPQARRSIAAERVAALPARLGPPCGVAVVAGAEGGEAALVATPTHLMLAVGPSGGAHTWPQALAHTAAQSSGWLRASLLIERAAGGAAAPPLLRVTTAPANPTVTHATWRAGGGAVYTLDFDASRAATGATADHASWAGLYVPASLRRLSPPANAPAATDLCTLPWHVLATLPTSPPQLLTFSRADGAPLGSSALPPRLAAARGAAPLLAVDSDDPHAEVHSPLGAYAVGDGALSRAVTPLDTLAACAALLRARRFDSARRLLERSQALTPGERSRGWGALGLAQLRTGDRCAAARAFGRILPTDAGATAAAGEARTTREALTFAEAAALLSRPPPCFADAAQAAFESDEEVCFLPNIMARVRARGSPEHSVGVRKLTELLQLLQPSETVSFLAIRSTVSSKCASMFRSMRRTQGAAVRALLATRLQSLSLDTAAAASAHGTSLATWLLVCHLAALNRATARALADPASHAAAAAHRSAAADVRTFIRTYKVQLQKRDVEELLRRRGLVELLAHAASVYEDPCARMRVAVHSALYPPLAHACARHLSSSQNPVRRVLSTAHVRAGKPTDALAALPAVASAQPEEAAEPLYTLLWRAPVATLTALASDEALLSVNAAVVAAAAIVHCRAPERGGSLNVLAALQAYLEAAIARGCGVRAVHDLHVRVLCESGQWGAFERCGPCQIAALFARESLSARRTRSCSGRQEMDAERR